MNPFKSLFLAVCLSCGVTGQAGAASATWTGTGDAATWNSDANWSAAFPNATTDTAGFTIPATITSLGQPISIASLTVGSGTGNVSISDSAATDILTINGGITNGTGQNLTLNLNTTLSAMQSVSVGSGSIVAFGAGSTLSTGNFAQALTGAGTINLNSAVAFGGNAAALTIQNGVTVNLAGAMSGTTTSNAIQVIGGGSTLNLQSNQSKKIQLGKAGTNEKANLFITTSGVNFSGVLAVAGAGAASGTAAQTVFNIGANIVGGGTATYSGSLNINNTANTNAETVVLSAAAGNTANFNGAIGSAAGTTGTLLQISGGGTVVFGAAGANTFATSTAANGTEVTTTGGNTVLQLNDTGGVALTGNTTVDNGATIQLLATGQMTSGTLTLNGAGGAAGTTGALENVSGTNTFAGAIALASASTISSDAGTLTVTNGVANGGNVLTMSGTGNITQTTAAISGPGGLAKTGSGVLTLASTNTYAGGTAISGGVLFANATGSTGTGAVTVNSGGTLGGTGSISPTAITSGAALTVASGGVLSPSNGSGGASLLTVVLTSGAAANSGGTAVLASGSKFVFDVGASTATSDRVVLTSSAFILGALTLNSQQITDFTFNPGTGFGPGTYTLISTPFANDIAGSLGAVTTEMLNGYALSLSVDAADQNVILNVAAVPVPEPGQWTMLLGAAAVIAWHWRRRFCQRQRNLHL